MEMLTRAISLVTRLKASADLVALAAELLPRLVASGRMSAVNAKTVLDQIPALKRDIQQQLDAVRQTMEAVQDRIEVLAQFLLLHRNALSEREALDVERLLALTRD